MQDIEEKAIQTYNENILYLQQKHPKVFHKLVALEDAIAKSLYKERYSLEYKDGYFDVLEIESGNFLYNSDSYKFAKKVSKDIDFTKTTNTYKTFKPFTNIIDPKKIEELDLEIRPLSSTAQLMDFYNHNASEDKTTMKKHYKFIFIGVGLGTHIIQTHKKLHSNIYLIIEDDLELFKLSLFVTNYSEIDKDNSNIIFSIFSDDSELVNDINLFLQDSFIYNQFIKFFQMQTHSTKPLKTIHQVIVGLDYLNFNFSALMMSSLRPLDYLQMGYKFLNINSLSKKLFGDKPALLLGAGPSLKNNIEWIKENQNKFVIVAISTILADLESHSIKVDIITHIHGFADAMVHIQKINDISFFNQSIVLAAALSYPQLIKYFNKENVYLFETNSNYKNGFGSFVSENVGSTSYLLLLKFQIEEIYLLGLDFALDQKSGSTHTNSHNYAYDLELQESGLNEEIDYQKDVVKVKGNFQDTVYSILIYQNWIKELNIVYNDYKTTTKNIYNLSDGAFINHTVPIHTDDIKITNLLDFNKNDFYKNLKIFMDNKSETYLTQDEMKLLVTLIEHANSKLNIINNYKNIKNNNIFDYHYKLLQFFQDILLTYNGKDQDELGDILSLYIKLISGYIFDIINTKELNNPKRVIKQLDKLFIPQVTRIITHFRDRLQDFLDKSETYKV